MNCLEIIVLKRSMAAGPLEQFTSFIYAFDVTNFTLKCGVNLVADSGDLESV